VYVHKVPEARCNAESPRSSWTKAHQSLLYTHYTIAYRPLSFILALKLFSFVSFYFVDILSDISIFFSGIHTLSEREARYIRNNQLTGYSISGRDNTNVIPWLYSSKAKHCHGIQDTSAECVHFPKYSLHTSRLVFFDIARFFCILYLTFVLASEYLQSWILCNREGYSQRRKKPAGPNSRRLPSCHLVRTGPAFVFPNRRDCSALNWSEPVLSPYSLVIGDSPAVNLSEPVLPLYFQTEEIAQLSTGQNQEWVRIL